ncbi:helix-turn-helix domain-containing protein [Methylobacterium soli]|uniref:Helix-turn-helix domain-containing protein n=2 Tax=Methylobacterium soli TaxID=553447 RepID=A0A6L3T1N2_9HYPH|nr:helix-turn-helix domain-containing protein [Methylobacterium soli]
MPTRERTTRASACQRSRTGAPARSSGVGPSPSAMRSRSSAKHRSVSTSSLPSAATASAVASHAALPQASAHRLPPARCTATASAANNSMPTLRARGEGPPSRRASTSTRRRGGRPANSTRGGEGASMPARAATISRSNLHNLGSAPLRPNPRSHVTRARCSGRSLIASAARRSSLPYGPMPRSTASNGNGPSLPRLPGPASTRVKSELPATARDTASAASATGASTTLAPFGKLRLEPRGGSPSPMTRTWFTVSPTAKAARVARSATFVMDEGQPGPVNATSMKASRSARDRKDPDEEVQDTGRPAISEEGWDYTTGIRLFQVGSASPSPGILPKVNEASAPIRMPGYVFKAARQLSGLSQRELSEAASVSKKGINDFENGLATLGPKLLERLIGTLQSHGVRFIEGKGVVGVVVVQVRLDFEESSRSPRRPGSSD